MTTITTRVSGTVRGQRHLNGPQTSGRAYRNLSAIVPTARRFRAGHRIRVFLASDDQNPDTPAIMGMRHASVGTTSLNTIGSSSRLLLPVLAAPQPGTAQPS